MRQKTAKEMRRAVKEKWPHLAKEENKDKFRKVYKEVKRQFKKTPSNMKNPTRVE